MARQAAAPHMSGLPEDSQAAEARPNNVTDGEFGVIIGHVAIGACSDRVRPLIGQRATKLPVSIAMPDCAHVL
jgi:hypothetical protein